MDITVAPNPDVASPLGTAAATAGPAPESHAWIPADRNWPRNALIARIVTPVMYKLIPPTIEVKKSAVAAVQDAPAQISPATP